METILRLGKNTPITFQINGYAATIVGPGPKGVGDKTGGNLEESVGYNDLSEEVGRKYMNVNYLLIGLFIGLILIPNVATASSPYGKMDVYYNGKLLPGEEIAKPILKIGEPFNIGINLNSLPKMLCLRDVV